ncbi:hypothetical protein [Streptomyces hydrogenans]|uniref:hypothetical protein n=1 Tax=Streptomyces hydrogenans TaxID=1873719 RepID=UPI0035E06024
MSMPVEQVPGQMSVDDMTEEPAAVDEGPQPEPGTPGIPPTGDVTEQPEWDGTNPDVGTAGEMLAALRDTSKHVAIPEGSTLEDVEARVCGKCAALYDRTEDFCFYSHEGSPEGAVEPLYETPGEPGAPEGGEPPEEAVTPPEEGGELPPMEAPVLESGPQVIPAPQEQQPEPGPGGAPAGEGVS